MPVESSTSPNTTGYISDLSTGQSTSTQRRRSSPVNNHTSSIESARGAPEPKSLLTWVYEGFCHILALIWDCFSSFTKSPLISREDSENDFRGLNAAQNGDESPVDFSDEEQFPLKGGSQDNSSDEDMRTERSGSNPESRISVLSNASGVIVDMPSDHDSQLSEITTDSMGGSQSVDISLSSNPISLGSDPRSSNSNPAVTGSDISHEENFDYTLAKVDTVVGEVDIPLFNGPIPTPLKISNQNKKEIQEVLTTIGHASAWSLGYSSLGSLWGGSSSGQIDKLKLLGENIDRDVHPLRFLLEIFLTPDSNAAIKALYASRNEKFTGRNFMWSQFVTDLGKSFRKRNDIADHTTFFAHRLGLKTEKIQTFVVQKKWGELLEHLIKHVKLPATNAR